MEKPLETELPLNRKSTLIWTILILIASQILKRVETD